MLAKGILEGEIACVHNGLCIPDKIEDYKKEYIKDILKRIKEIGDIGNETNINFNETEVIED